MILRDIFEIPTELRNGLCVGDPNPDDWHLLRTDGGLTVGNERALSICRQCPETTRIACLKWASDHGETGIWGGTTEAQRRRTSSRLTWTREETDRLRTMAEHLSPSRIAEALGKPVSAVTSRAQHLGIRIRKASYAWTQREDEELLELRGKGKSIREISESLGRGETSISDRIKELRRRGVDVPRATSPGWTSDEDSQMMRMFAAGATVSEVSEQIGRSESAVRNRRRTLAKRETSC